MEIWQQVNKGDIDVVVVPCTGVEGDMPWLLVLWYCNERSPWLTSLEMVHRTGVKAVQQETWTGATLKVFTYFYIHLFYFIFINVFFIAGLLSLYIHTIHLLFLSNVFVMIMKWCHWTDNKTENHANIYSFAKKMMIRGTQQHNWKKK